MGHLDRLQHIIQSKYIHDSGTVFRVGTSVTAEYLHRTPGCSHGDMFVIS